MDSGRKNENHYLCDHVYSLLKESLCVCVVLCLTGRPDASQNNLRTSAYEALMDLIKYSAKVSNWFVCLCVDAYSGYEAAYRRLQSYASLKNKRAIFMRSRVMP